MRRQLVVLTFAGLAFLPPAIAAAPAVGDDAANAAPVAVQRMTLPYRPMRDEAAMVLIGSGLIALAAAVRRASPDRARCSRSDSTVLLPSADRAPHQSIN